MDTMRSPATRRSCCRRRVKFSLSRGSASMPASRPQGYSQSISTPSSPYSSSARPTDSAKSRRPFSRRLMSEKPPAPQPPTDRTNFSPGFMGRMRFISSFRQLSLLMSSSPSRMTPNATFTWVSFRASSPVICSSPFGTAYPSSICFMRSFPFYCFCRLYYGGNFQFLSSAKKAKKHGI